eukprot:gene10803-12780_t
MEEEGAVAANVVQGAINAIHKDTGFQVAVALLGRTRRGDNRGAEEMSRGLHDSWGVGEKDKNNGVLFLLAKYDRQLYISTGKGALKQLPNDALDKIIARAKPQLREEKYDKAVEQVVDDIGAALGGEVLPEVKTESEGNNGWGVSAVGAAILLYFAGIAKSGWDRHTFVRQYRAPDMMEAALLTSEQDARRTPGEMVPVTISCGHSPS